MIRFIVDSTCDLPEEIMEKYGILMMPLHVILKGRDYRDKVEITTDEVFSAMHSGILPKTSQVSPADVYQTFQGCCERGEDFIYLAFSAALSGTYQLAETVLAKFQPNYPDRKMRIIDSKSGSVAIGLMALQAVKMAEAGYDFAAVSRHIAYLTEHIEHVFTIADIGWLVKGGRITKLQGMLGSLLDIRPILDVKNGLLHLMKKARGSQKALNMVADTLVERIEAFPGQIIGIAHSDNLPGAEELKNLLAERTGTQNFIISKIGSVLGSHLGIGGLGLFFFNQKPAPYFPL
ncbi:DegV family protein [Candidatus Desulfosporosinus nitrosoreducens]|uniref:DegV family protein n=1 Tax=Candidatus Desulfosporosinus nitrosoreducens TaxID=3401928 RepID=UPI00280B18CA|nr:DegV family protein [Desulfosporosinus sp. PR]